jgi:flagellar basal-body rod modification protein FlgD
MPEITGTVPTPPVGTWPSASTAPAAAPRRNDELDKDAFLKLLVAQLRYQDPSSPMDTSQFMAQTAQFTSVEKLTQLADSQTALVASQGFLQAAAVVGQTVSWTTPEGTEATGRVSAARFGPSGPVLTVGDTEVPIAMVTRLTSPAQPAPSAEPTKSAQSTQPQE